jgi:hypothetical protein
MATLNPIATVRDNSSSPSIGRGTHEIVGWLTGTGTDAVTVETKLQSIISAIVIDETAGAVVATARGDSTTYVGTKTVVFTLANSKVYSYRIVGIVGTRAAATTETISGATTITYEPLKGG